MKKKQSLKEEFNPGDKVTLDHDSGVVLDKVDPNTNKYGFILWDSDNEEEDWTGNENGIDYNLFINSGGKIVNEEYPDLEESEKGDEKYLLHDDENVDEDITVGIDDDDPEVTADEIKQRNPNKIVKYTDKEGNTVELQKNESKIITKNSFKEIVNNYGKISLSESNIISILKETQNPIMSKSELVEEFSKQLISEANMNDNVRRNFESGEHDYSEHLERELAKNISDEVFREIQEKIREKVGHDRVTIEDAQQLLGNSLMEAAKKEYEYGIENLERKAVEMIRAQFNMPADAVDVEATITGLNPRMVVGRNISPQEAEQLSRQARFKVSAIDKGQLKHEKGNIPKPEGASNEEVKNEITRRRFNNALMHGAARKSQNLHFMDDELAQNVPDLSRDYGNIMAANDFNYWALDDNTIKTEGSQGIHAGNSRIDLSGDKPKIIAQGMVFPILLHELTKGVMELMSLHSLPQDRDLRQHVLDNTDNLDAETNDIRLGQHIWTKIVENIPVDNQEVISLTFNYLQQLPTEDFNNLIKGLLNGDQDAKNRVETMANEALEQLRNEAYKDSTGGYEDSPEDETPPDDIPPDDDVLTQPGGQEVNPAGIEDQPPEDTEPNYSSMSKRDLERAIDAALDSGDMNLVKKIGSYLN